MKEGLRMRIAGLVTAAGLVLAAGPAWAAQPLPEPIAPASQGKSQCYEPDTAAKTCRSIAKYQRGPKGEILNPALVMISAQPLIAFASTTKVEVKGGQCAAWSWPPTSRTAPS
ncbi:MAG TPA: hypothetical protein VHX64_12215 [Caulobacteraceae bacterium]|jgi:hypothetical protein|nr:hypothetical protein [Caulobacteraceae bacterium]